MDLKFLLVTIMLVGMAQSSLVELCRFMDCDATLERQGKYLPYPGLQGLPSMNFPSAVPMPELVQTTKEQSCLDKGWCRLSHDQRKDLISGRSIIEEDRIGRTEGVSTNRNLMSENRGSHSKYCCIYNVRKNLCVLHCKS